MALPAAKVTGPIANYTPNIKPITVEGLVMGGYNSNAKVQLSVHEARRLRDSLSIVLKGLEGSPFDDTDSDGS